MIMKNNICGYYRICSSESTFLILNILKTENIRKLDKLMWLKIERRNKNRKTNKDRKRLETRNILHLKTNLLKRKYDIS